MKKFHAIALAAAVTALSAVPSFAAGTLDFTGVTTAVTAEINPAIVAAMPIAGLVLAVGIGWRIYKRFTK